MGLTYNMMKRWSSKVVEEAHGALYVQFISDAHTGVVEMVMVGAAAKDSRQHTGISQPAPARVTRCAPNT